MKLHWKIVLTVFVALAVVFGFIFRKNLAYILFGSKTTVIHRTSPSADSLEGYYQEALNLKPQETKTSATFLAVGDIMLSRGVATTIEKSGNADLPFLGLSDILKSTDFNFGNLESPVAPDSIPCHLQPDCANFKLSKNSKTGISGGHSLIFAAPFSYLAGLADYNFKIVNLANNHAFDQGLEGLKNTKLALGAVGELSTSTNALLEIKSVGTGSNQDEAWEPAVVSANGIKICFIGASFSSINDGGQTKNDYVARIQDTDKLKSAITKAKTQCDYVVVTMHAGIEYTRNPNKAQITFAHTAIDDGADMVIGAHPHWIQTIDKYCPRMGDPSIPSDMPYDPTKCKYIFYSLGNFIFDQSFSQDTSEGLTLKIKLTKNQQVNPTINGAASLDDLQGNRIGAQLDSVELLPVEIKNSAPTLATEEETKSILKKIGQTESILK